MIKFNTEIYRLLSLQSHWADEIPNIEFVGVPVWEHFIFAINPKTIQKVDRCSQGRAALNDISNVFFSWRVKGKSCGLSGLAGCSESTLGLQHALLLPGAGQRGGGGGGDATRGAESLATGGCMSSRTIGRVFAKLSLWSSQHALIWLISFHLSETRQQRPARRNWKRKWQLSGPCWKVTGWKKVKPLVCVSAPFLAW